MIVFYYLIAHYKFPVNVKKNRFNDVVMLFEKKEHCTSTNKWFNVPINGPIIL